MAEITTLIDALKYSLEVTREQTKRMMTHFGLSVPSTASHVQDEVTQRHIPISNDHTDILQTWIQTDPNDVARYLTKDRRYRSKPLLSAYAVLNTSSDSSEHSFVIDITGDPKKGTLQSIRMYKDLFVDDECAASIECLFFNSEEQLLTYIQKAKQDPFVRSITRDITKKTLIIQEKQEESELSEHLIYHDLGTVTIGETKYLVFAQFEGKRKPPRGNSPIREVHAKKVTDPVLGMSV